MRFAHPLALLASLGLPLIWWLAARGRPSVTPGRIAWRTAAAALLVLAASGLAVAIGQAPMTVIVALDRSASIPSRAQRDASARVNVIADTMRAGDRLGVVAFGADAALEFGPAEGARLVNVQTAVADTGTDIGAAIRLARAALPQDGARRILLLSDGRDTAGGAEREALAAAAAEIQVDVAPPAAADAVEPLRVTRVIAPADVSVLEPYHVAVEVAGTVGARGSVVIYRDDAVAQTSPVTIGADGTATLVLSERQDQARAYVYRALTEAEAAIGDRPSAGAVVVVEGEPRILYVSSVPPALGSALSGVGFKVTHVVPEQLAATAGALASFSGVVLDDVPPEAVAPAAVEALTAYVEREGGGLLILGTSRALTPGGYAATPLERILPIDLRPRAGQRMPSAELVLVFDKSGSMADVTGGVPKIEVARQAVMRAVDVMPPGDKVGVIAFDSAPVSVVPLAPVGDARTLRDNLQAVVPRGGTSIAPAIDTALQWLGASPDAGSSGRRQVLLISDGQTTPEDEARLRARARTAGVPLSVVAIGPNANRTLLEDLASASGGRAYFPNRLTDLPGTVAREAARSSGGGVVTERFRPHATAHPVLTGIDVAALPTLNGYVVSAAKPTATAILASHLDDPILCAWRVGLGRVAVFTADLASPWSAPLRSWSDGGRLWAQTVRWLSRRDRDSAVRLQIVDAEAGPRLEVEAATPDGAFLALDSVAAVMRSPVGADEHIVVEAVAPGRYQAPVPVSSAGPYVVAITAHDRDTQAEHHVVRALYWSGDRESQATGTDVQSLSRLAAAGGGRVLGNGESPFEAARPSGYLDCSAWAALAALAMFVLDIAR